MPAQDQATARQWYEAAAAAGSTRAQNNLGMMCCEGRGGPVDESLAVQWFKMGAAGGNISAASNLGMCYEEGIGATDDTFLISIFQFCGLLTTNPPCFHCASCLVKSNFRA